ncbi:nuclear transport factor 2 family protein [Ekhidna sp.]|uniref:nuclear transport factor 2 family protein n=1 Tax=Ekhidna sp. TaxID=2608089 RepID=UPI003B50EABD
MRKNKIMGLMMLLIMACNEKSDTNGNSASAPSAEKSNLTALEVVNKRMALFNANNYDEFIKLYHADLKVYTYPDKLMGKGSDRLASIFKSDFDNKLVAVEIVNQMENGPYVINHELVINDGKKTKYISIYKVENGLITNVSFVREF